MAKETQKSKIERLENTINELQEIINNQNRKIEYLEQKLKKEIKSNEEDLREAYRESAALELQIASNDREYNRHIKELEKYYTYELYKLKNEKNSICKIHNERGAGRKSRFTDEQIKEIKQYRTSGKTIKEIAELFNCSVGLIHKIINN